MNKTLFSIVLSTFLCAGASAQTTRTHGPAVVSTRRKSFHAIAEFRLLHPRKSHAASFTAVKNTVNRQDL